jgi:hypothetical protein
MRLHYVISITVSVAVLWSTVNAKINAYMFNRTPSGSISSLMNPLAITSFHQGPHFIQSYHYRGDGDILAEKQSKLEGFISPRLLPPLSSVLLLKGRLSTSKQTARHNRDTGTNKGKARFIGEEDCTLRWFILGQ